MHQHLALSFCLVAGISALAEKNASLASLSVNFNEERFQKEVGRAPKWLQQSLYSTVRSAASMSKGPHSRALAMDEGLCGMAMFVVPMAILFGALPAVGGMLADKDVFCDLMKQYGNFNMDGTEKNACSGKSKADCYNGCEWQEMGDQAECTLYGMPLFLGVVNPDADTPARMMMEGAIACNKLSKVDCTGDCIYKEMEGKCDTSEAFTKKYACENANSVALMTTGCDTKSKDSCSGDCAWKPEEDKCDVAPAKFNELMFGKSSGAKMMKDMETLGKCMADTACTASGCDKDEEGNCVMATDPDLKTAMMECGAKAKDACSGDCAWSENEKKCEPSPSKMGDVCGWEANVGGVDAAILRSQLSPLASVLLITSTIFMQF